MGGLVGQVLYLEATAAGISETGTSASAQTTAWREVRRRNADWLLKWEPMRTPGAPDPVESRDAFAVRCGARSVAALDDVSRRGSEHGAADLDLVSIGVREPSSAELS